MLLLRAALLLVLVSGEGERRGISAAPVKKSVHTMQPRAANRTHHEHHHHEHHRAHHAGNRTHGRARAVRETKPPVAQAAAPAAPTPAAKPAAATFDGLGPSLLVCVLIAIAYATASRLKCAAAAPLSERPVDQDDEDAGIVTA